MGDLRPIERVAQASTNGIGPQRANVVHAFRFHPWKKAYVRRYLARDAAEVSYFHRPERLRRASAGDALLLWGAREVPALLAIASERSLAVWHMEDGFIRSVGLGSDRTVPASLVVDAQGIYYDPTRPSDLESILERLDFSADELARAARLRESIVALGVSKYNVGDRTVALPRPSAGKRVVLVPGQVEDDASIRLGCVDVRTNAALLEAARAARPDAFIIYKAHPDVVSGNRRGAVPDEITRRCADAVVVDAPLPACLALADEVHTMTSLVGFEALMRGLAVTAYGLPFYAGWGLCEDRHAHPRRTRRLSLDALVAGALIRYPRYLHPETQTPTTPEEVVMVLQRQLARLGHRPVRMGWLERKTMKLWNAAKGMIGR